MNSLNIANNIARLRHDKKITQEELAEFIGVTKALFLNGRTIKVCRI